MEYKEKYVPGKIEKVPGCKDIEATPEDDMTHELDPAGYFLIKIDNEKGLIEAAMCKDYNKISFYTYGKTAKALIDTIIREKATTHARHLSYLAREFQKAEIALTYPGLFGYVQDSPLIKLT